MRLVASSYSYLDSCLLSCRMCVNASKHKSSEVNHQRRWFLPATQMSRKMLPYHPSNTALRQFLLLEWWSSATRLPSISSPCVSLADSSRLFALSPYWTHSILTAKSALFLFLRSVANLIIAPASSLARKMIDETKHVRTTNAYCTFLLLWHFYSKEKHAECLLLFWTDED